MADGALDLRALNRATLARQGLLEPLDARTPEDAVRRLGSLQAQHPDWPRVALRARVTDSAAGDLAAALDARRVVRASLMRITIHVVAVDDYWPMHAATQPLRRDQWRLLLKADAADSPLGRRMHAAHPAALEALRSGPATATALDRLIMARVGEVDSAVARIGWRHLAAHVPLVHVPWPGEGYGRSRYALAEDWLGARDEVPLEEARRRIARRYLAAFGPASVEDLAAYVGRGRGGIGVWKAAVAALGEEAMSLPADDGRTLHDLADAPRPTADRPAPPRLLARWDSLLLSHEPRRRTRVLPEAHRARVITNNADVLPTFLVDGMVAGTWMPRDDGDPDGPIELRPFARLAPADREALEAEGARVLAAGAPRTEGLR